MPDEKATKIRSVSYVLCPALPANHACIHIFYAILVPSLVLKETLNAYRLYLFDQICIPVNF
jgi:hypothetical protein